MDIGNRMKENYELPCRHRLTRRVPVIIRIDGKAFHTYTRHMDKPFDKRLMDTMALAALDTMEQMQGCKCAYVQSDEASFLLTDFDTLETQPWMGYVQSKLESIAASVFTASFNRLMFDLYTDDMAFFDARAFSVPREEVANYFLWRAKDWERNSVSMYCRSFFSHKEMDGKGRADQHEMLHSIGKNWTYDLTDQEKNGTWLTWWSKQPCYNILPVYGNIAAVTDKFVFPDTVAQGETACSQKP